jgi:hypothetical protein
VILAGNVAAFNLRYQPGAGVKIAGVFSGNLSNSGEQLILTGPGGTIKDFTYGDSAPWPNAADGDGYSLVLNNPVSNPDANLPQSWRSSAEVNGTPGSAPGPVGPTGSAAAALADTDGDGVSDLLEYATGTQPGNPASHPALVSGSQSFTIPPAVTPASYLTFEYRRSRSADGFSLEPEISTGLSGWLPLSSQFTLVSQTNNADGFHLRAGILR